MSPGLSIACAADAAYVPHAAAMLHSLAAQHDPGSVRVHFLHDAELGHEEVAALGRFADGLGLDWQPVLVDCAHRRRFPVHPRFGQVAWYRVLLSELVASERVLYLDCDAVITDSLVPLSRAALDGNAVGAVTNALYPGTALGFLAELGVPSAADYFNSGVLLLDLERWRDDDIVSDILAFVDRGLGLDLWPDQTALNAVLWSRRQPLAPRWNAQNTVFDLPPSVLPFSSDDVAEARMNPAIVHFIGPYKPWHHRSKHPYRSRYFEHLDQTPWAGRPIEGVTPFHRALRLLPSALGLRTEARLRRLATSMARRIKR